MNAKVVQERLGHTSITLTLDTYSYVLTLLRAGRVEEAIEQLRETIDLDPQWSSAWGPLTWALLEAGEYDAAAEVALEQARLNPAADPVVEERWIEAAIGYLRSGEPQTFRFPESYEALFFLPLRYGWTGQRGPTLGALETAAIAGLIRAVSSFHASRHSELLSDDLRYQALLEEAGSTW